MHQEISITGPDFTKLTDLASERLGGKGIKASDDFFAEKENLLKPGRGIFITDKYTDRGKWMDGNQGERELLAMTGASLNWQLRVKFMV